MRHVFAPTLALVATLALSPPVLAQEETDPPPPLDPQAIGILQSAADYLAGHQQMSVDWFVSYDEVIDGREKLTSIRSGHSLIDRDAGLYAYVENALKTREFFFDGASFQIYDVDEDAYVLVPFGGTLEELSERIRREHDTVLPIWGVVGGGNRGELIDRAEQAAYLGVTRIAGRTAHHVALSSYDEDWQVWVADDAETPEILMLVGTDPYTQGWPQYRVYFSNWNFAPEIAEDAFTFAPGEDTERMVWPKVASQGN